MADSYELRMDWRVKPIGKNVVLGPEGRQRFKRSFHGCESCKAWRKKCDEKKPSCSLCRHRNTECVYNDARTGEHKTIKTLTKPNVTSSSFNSTMDFAQICSCFWGSSKRQSYRGRLTWVARMMDMPHKSPALQASLAAVALGRLGQKHNDSVMSTRSQTLYANALQATQRALWLQEVWSVDTLLSIRMLHLYEAIQCPRHDVQASVSHCQGFSSYIIESLKHQSDLSLTETGISVVEDAFFYGAEMSCTNRCMNSPQLIAPIFDTWLTKTPYRQRRPCILAQFMSPMGWEACILPFSLQDQPIAEQEAKIKDYVDRLLYYEAEVAKCRDELPNADPKALSGGDKCDIMTCYTHVFVNGLSLMHCIQAVQFIECLKVANATRPAASLLSTSYAVEKLERLSRDEYWLRFANSSIRYLETLASLPDADSAATIVLGQGLLWTLHCRQGLPFEDSYVHKFAEVFGLEIVPVLEKIHQGTLAVYGHSNLKNTWEVFRQWSKNFVEPGSSTRDEIDVLHTDSIDSLKTGSRWLYTS